MKKCALFTLAILIFTPSIVFASNANPPIINSIEQITKGPYSVGDVVSYKINYSGGEPGIQSINLFLNNDCLFSYAGPSMIGIRVKDEGTYRSSDSKIISGWVKPCRFTTVQPLRVIIRDLTQLTATKELIQSPELSFQVNPSDLNPTPIGEIKPVKMKDSLDLSFIPASPKSKQSFELPRLTANRVPIFWKSMSPTLCKINTAFEGDLGGSLVILKPGNCTLRVSGSNTDKYENPSIITKARISQSGMASLLIFTAKR